MPAAGPPVPRSRIFFLKSTGGLTRVGQGASAPVPACGSLAL
jgi:hypothetical protein